MKKIISIEVSAKHIHLSQKDLEAFFGRGYKLKKLKDLTQSGEFAAKETLDIQVGNKKLSEIRVIGPVRKQTQVELSLTDSIELGINPPIRKSGDLKTSPGIILIGPKKRVKIRQGVIIAQRHIHCNSKEAKSLKLKNGQVVSVKITGKRGLIFNNIKIRANKKFKLCMHLDTDEGNASGINKKGKGILL